MRKIDGIYLQLKTTLAKPENKRRLTLGTVVLVIFAVIVSLVINFFPYKNAQALDVANGDGLIMYGISANTTPQWRTYNGSTNTFGAQTTTVAGGTGTNFQVRTSPTKQEAIAAYTNSSGVLQVMCYNGTSWTNEWSVTAGGAGAKRPFDIAYETNTGDVMVLYSRNAAATNAVDYRTKAGSLGCGTANWAAAASMPTGTSLTTGTVHWVKMDFDGRSTSNLIAAIWADSNADLGGAIWDGTAWVNLKLMETSLEVVTAAQDVDDFELQYESLSGDLMVIWANSLGAAATNGVRYMTCTGGTSTCTYSAVITPATWANDATNLDLSANPNSDEMVFASLGNAGSDLQVGYWSGSAWTNTNDIDAISGTPLAGTKLVSASWLISGATTRSIVTYNDASGAAINWYVGNAGTFTLQTDFATTPALGSPNKWLDLQKDPFNKDRLIFTVSDLNNDVFAKRLIMTATPAFTWTNADGATALQATLPAAIAAPFQFRYWRFIPATTTLSTGSDPAAATIAPGAAATDVDLFTLQTSAGTEAITSVTVNLSTNNGIGTLAITDNANTVLGSTTSPVTGSNTITVSGMSATTTLTTFKVRVTPLAPSAMPVPPGALYAITAPVTSWAGPNTHAGSDTNPNALTIDNLSPNGATLTSGSAGNAQVTLNWTTSSSTDFSRSAVLRWTGASAGSEVPAEGTDYSNENTIGTATVVCIRTTDAASTAVSGTDGAGTGGCSATALTNGQAYTYKVFQKDSNGNYDVGVSIGTFTPIANTAPNSPASLAQKKTTDVAITVNTWTNETSVKFTATASDTDNPDTLYLCIEKDQTGTAFSGTEDSCGSGVAYSGTPVTVINTISGQTDATLYHWQARIKDAANAYSGWVSFGGNTDPNDMDYGIDTTAPTGGTVTDSANTGLLTQLDATLSGFNANVSGLNKYEYAIGTTSGGIDIKTWTNNGTSTTITATGLNLQTSVTYYFTARATDNATNLGTAVNSTGQMVLPTLSFTLGGTSVNFNNLNAGNSYTDTKNHTLAVTTNAANGYTILGYTIQVLTSLQYPSKNIANYAGTWAVPTIWSGYGFGYTSSDNLVQGSDRFGSGTKYAGFTQTLPGDIAADHTAAINGSTGEANDSWTITYKVATTTSQEASTYQTTAIYIVVPNF